MRHFFCSRYRPRMHVEVYFRGIHIRDSMPGTTNKGVTSREHECRDSLLGTRHIGAFTSGGLHTYTGVLFQEPRTLGITSRNHVHRGLLPGTTYIGDYFQEPRTYGITSTRNHVHRELLPGTMYIGNYYQEPRTYGITFRNHVHRGLLPGTTYIGNYYQEPRT